MIQEAKNVFTKKFGDRRFFVLLYPGSFEGEVLADYLREAGIEVLDYTHLIRLGDPENYFPVDLHPTAPAHAAVAKQLALDVLRMDQKIRR